MAVPMDHARINVSTAVVRDFTPSMNQCMFSCQLMIGRESLVAPVNLSHRSQEGATRRPSFLCCTGEPSNIQMEEE